MILFMFLSLYIKSVIKNMNELRTKKFEDLQGRDYQIVLADPPWQYYGDPNKNQAAGKHYKMMSYEELKSLHIRSIMAKKSILFCWTTSSKMSETCKLIEDWGLHYRGVFQVWVKTSSSGKISHGNDTTYQ